MLTIATYRTIPNCGSTILSVSIGLAAWKMRKKVLVIDCAEFEDPSANATVSSLKAELNLTFEVHTAATDEELAACDLRARSETFDLVVYDLPPTSATDFWKAKPQVLCYAPFRNMVQLEEIASASGAVDPHPCRYIPIGFANFAKRRTEVMDFGPIVSSAAVSNYSDVGAALSNESTVGTADRVLLWREIEDLAKPATWSRDVLVGQ